MGTTTQARVLDAALQVFSEGSNVSLESVAKQAGLSKPGLMYHYPTKQDLMLGLVEYVADRWEARLSDYLTPRPEDASPTDRIRAYFEAVLSDKIEPTDLVMFSDTRLRDQLSARWETLTAKWLDLPDDLDPALRARLLLLRLAADGIWYAEAGGVHPLNQLDTKRVRDLVDSLLEES